MKRDNPEGINTLFRRLPASLVMLACALFACIFIPALRHQAALFAVAGMLLTAMALATAIHQRSGTGHHIRTATLSLATGLVAFLATVSLTLAWSGPAQAATIDDSALVPEVTTEYNPQDAKVFADQEKQASEVVPVSASRRYELITTVQERRYMPRSGARQLWNQSDAYSLDGNVFLIVPLSSQRELKQANRLIYWQDQAGVHTEEIFGVMRDPSTVNVKVWREGRSVVNRTVINHSQGTGLRSSLVGGVDWGALNSCLSNAGIGWAVISLGSAACGFACAISAGGACIPCLAGVFGGSVGVIAGCVHNAWR